MQVAAAAICLLVNMEQFMNGQAPSYHPFPYVPNPYLAPYGPYATPPFTNMPPSAFATPAAVGIQPYGQAPPSQAIFQPMVAPPALGMPHRYPPIHPNTAQPVTRPGVAQSLAAPPSAGVLRQHPNPEPCPGGE